MRDPQLWLGIIGLIVSAGVAYHIASRQGGLTRARGRILYGLVPNKGERPKQPWTIVGSENQREASFTFWLAAVLSDDEAELEKRISLLAEALDAQGWHSNRKGSTWTAGLV